MRTILLADCEHKLEQVLSERSNVSDSLAKTENITANLETEKQKLQEDLQKVNVLRDLFVESQWFFRCKMKN